MTDEALQFIDLDAERALWQRTDGVPGYPYSSHWHLISAIAVGVLQKNPRGGRGPWLAAIRSKVEERGVVVPSDAFDVIADACLARLASFNQPTSRSYP